MRDEVLLKAEVLSSCYGKLEALKGVSIEVRRGESVAVLGANGAGKTTLLRTLARLLPASKGKVYFMGEDVTSRPAHELVARGLALVPEGRLIFGPLSVLENLQLGAITASRRGGKEATGETLEWVLNLFPRLKERLRQRAGTLSGGEQQMLAIGRALMSRPQVLLLDEPSLGLAPLVVEKIYETLAELNRNGLTLLVVEQNVDLALSVAHRGYVMETGRVVLEGDVSVLLGSDVAGFYLGSARAGAQAMAEVGEASDGRKESGRVNERLQA